MEGAERIMLGSNNYLGLTADPRVRQAARDALDRYGTGLTGSRLLNGTLDLHLDLERELAEWMGTEEAIVFSTGHQANVGTLGTILAPGDTVIVDSADHASILDGCLISRAKLRPFKHNRLEKLEKMLQRAAEDGGGVLVVVDGVFSMEGDIAPLPRIVELCKAYGARLMVDEAHGAGVLGARGAGASRAVRRRGRRRPAHGDLQQVARVLRRLHRRPARGDRLPADLEPRVPVHRVRRPGRRGRRAGRAADHPLARGPGAVREAARQRALPQPRPAASSATGSIEPEPTITPVVPVVVGDDWKAVLLWRALYDAGVYVNVAIHPAVPPGGALLRTSVMATHDRAVLDRALVAFENVKQNFEREHGPLPEPLQ